MKTFCRIGLSVLLLLLVFLLSASADVTSGLILRYDFDIDNGAAVLDQSSVGNNGVVSGAVWSASGGVSGGAYVFRQGMGDCIRVPASPTIALDNKPFTISVWVNHNHTTNAPLFVGKGMPPVPRPTLDDEWLLMGTYPNGQANFTFHGDDLLVSKTPAYWISQWHHMVSTFDPSTRVQKMYLDGSLVGSRTAYAKLRNTDGADFCIGFNGHESARTIDGKMDNIRVYDRVLSSGEVETLYAEALGKVKFSIAGSPGQYGTPQPQGYGVGWVAAGSLVTNTVAHQESSNTRRICTGWTGSGNVPVSGDGTSVVFTASEASSVTWQWRSEFLLDTASGPNGSVDVSDGWHTNGSLVTVTATPASGYRFVLWAGDVPLDMISSNSVTLAMDRARSITAVFGLNDANVADGLILRYDFDVDNGAAILDQSGVGNDGVVSGAVWSASGGISGGAYEFRQGMGDCIRVPATSKIALDNKPFTISVWVNHKHATNAPMFIGKGMPPVPRTTLDEEFLMMGTYPNGQVNFTFHGDDLLVSKAPSFWTNQWHHMVSTFDPATRIQKMYLDGALVGSRTAYAKLRNTDGADFCIGFNGHESPRTIDGKVDEVRVYARVLGASEVAELYSGASGKLGFTVAGVPAQYGNPLPNGYGLSWLNTGSVVTNIVANQEITNNTRRICTGWTGTGSVPASGSGTSVVFTISQASVLTWNWRSEYFLDMAAGSKGVVNVADGWHTNGAVVTITATPDDGCDFVEWTGTVPSGHAQDNPLSVTMDQARSLSAVFEGAPRLSDGLVLHFDCNSDNGTNVYDLSGMNNDGVASGAVWTASGKIGGAYSVSGTGDCVWVEPSDSLKLDGKCFSISYWVYNDHLTNYRSYLGRAIPPIPRPTLDEEFLIMGTYPNGQAIFTFHGDDLLVTRQPSFWTQSWHHLVATFDATTRVQKLYIDGALGGSRTAKAVLRNTDTANLCFGFDGLQPAGSLDGKLDEIRVYNRVVSANEAKALYDLINGDGVNFVVAGSPARCGRPSPHNYGTNVVAKNSVVTNSVASPSVGGPGIRHICTGWTGGGAVPESGSGSSVSFVAATNSSVMWHWYTEYLLDTAAGSGGSVDVQDGWHSNGTAVVMTAAPVAGCRFTGWTGDVPGGQETANPLTVTMDRARTITAQFASDKYRIAGRIYYNGQLSGPVRIEVATDADYSATAAWTTLAGPGSYTITNLSGGCDYWVRAFLDVNENGSPGPAEPIGGYPGNPVQTLSSNSAAVDIYLEALSAPQGLEARGCASSITLSWQPNPEPGIAGYNIYRYEEEWQEFQKINGAPVAGISFSDLAVDSGCTYYYYITAVRMSDSMSSYVESPASAIVAATAGEVAFRMSDCNGKTGSVVRVRVNVSDADGILGKDMRIGIEYNPDMLTPVTQVTPGQPTVERTAMTWDLNVTNNAATATGLLEIATSAGGLTNRHATLRMLGCSYENMKRRPITLTAMFKVAPGTNWAWVNDGKNINDGCSYSADLGSPAYGTNCVVKIVDSAGARQIASDDQSGFVRRLLAGDSMVSVPGVYGLEDVQYYLREFVNDDLSVNIRSNEVVYLFELDGVTNGAAADFQDVVALVEYDEGTVLAGQGHLFDVLFRVSPAAVYGSKATNRFAYATVKDRAGCLIQADCSDTAVVSVQDAFILGDINGDGVVNVNGDFTLAMKIAVGQRGPTGDELMAGDINGDGAITKADATLIKRIAFGLPLNPTEEDPHGQGPLSDTPPPAGYQLWIADLEVVAGTELSVPVWIDSAASVANADLRISFDPNILYLLGATNTLLTGTFGIEYQAGDGYVDIVMSGSQGLLDSGGELAMINFLVSPNAAPGAASGLTFSKCGLGDAFGADLAWSSGIVCSNGSVVIILPDSRDSDGDGLTDYEEQHADGAASYNPFDPEINRYGTDTDAQNPDTDGDGMNDGDEQTAHTSGTDPDDVLEVTSTDDCKAGPGAGFEIRWKSASQVKYSIMAGTNLLEQFQAIATNIAGTDSIMSYTDTNSVGTATRYYRVKVEE